MFHCDRCAGEFNEFRTAGKCPLCDQWMTMECTGCGHSAPSMSFIKAGAKCPKCGRAANVPGRSKTSFLVVAGLIAVIVAFAVFVYMFATFKTSSRPLPDIKTRTIQTPD